LIDAYPIWAPAASAGQGSGFVVSTFFNNKTFSVLGTGLSGTQFQVSFTGFSGGSDTGVATPQFGYRLSGITQPAQKSDPQSPGHFQALLWSSGVGSRQPGNVITVYYVHIDGEPNRTARSMTLQIFSANASEREPPKIVKS
jgi:hypothetical protein